MSLLKHILRMKHIDSLMRHSGACSSQKLADKLKLSRSTTLVYVNDMKKLGFPIRYSRKDKCYYYQVHGKMVDHFFERK